MLANKEKKPLETETRAVSSIFTMQTIPKANIFIDFCKINVS